MSADALEEDVDDEVEEMVAKSEQVEAHLDLWQALDHLEDVDFRHVPGVSVAEAAAFAERLREADEKLKERHGVDA